MQFPRSPLLFPPLAILLFIIKPTSTSPMKSLEEHPFNVHWYNIMSNDQLKDNFAEHVRTSKVISKSVFIAPSFKEKEKFQVFNWNEESHLDFLLQKLNQKLDNETYKYSARRRQRMRYNPRKMRVPLQMKEVENK